MVQRLITLSNVLMSLVHVNSLLIATIGFSCCGCTSLVTEENLVSEVNEEGIESESLKKQIVISK